MKQGGFVLQIPAEATGGPPLLEYNLEVLDPLQEPGPIADDTPLTALPMLVLDTETTGLAGAGTIAFMVGVAFFEEQAFALEIGQSLLDILDAPRAHQPAAHAVHATCPPGDARRTPGS